MKGLIIRSPWIDKILIGEKIWEIRGTATKIRGRIFLIKSGTGKIFGEVKLVDCFELDTKTYSSSSDKHGIPAASSLPYKKTYAWVLEAPVRYENPIPYKHPSGAVIWVNI